MLLLIYGTYSFTIKLYLSDLIVVPLFFYIVQMDRLAANVSLAATNERYATHMDF